MKTTLITLKATADPNKFRGQRRVIVETLQKLGATRKPVQLAKVASIARPKLHLKKTVKPVDSVRYHLRGLRASRVVAITREKNGKAA